MTLQPFTDFTSRAVPLNRHNVDTDQIIAARFLKGTAKTGLGQHLFYDLRYDANENPKPDFSLNDPKFSGAQILVSGHNFGCGSSREHAPWSLTDYGFKAIIAISFADIFKNNATKNHLLPIALPEAVVLGLLADIDANPALELTIKLNEQCVILPNGQAESFDIDPFRKSCLMEGVDDIGYTLKRLPAIEAYERTHPSIPVSQPQPAAPGMFQPGPGLRPGVMSKPQ